LRSGSPAPHRTPARIDGRPGDALEPEAAVSATPPPLSVPYSALTATRDPLDAPCGCAIAGALREARLFRAALADALELEVERLAAALAVEVLGRELQLGGCELEAIAKRLVAERRSDEPLRLRVAPGDAHISCGLPVVGDVALALGDAILECRSGEIDASLRIRLAAIQMAEQP
jgi:hypothetical protein